jgi:predicted SnoaL-like aldol condensation-catalyzing enzyme
MIRSSEDQRVKTVLNAFDILFNKPDYASAAAWVVADIVRIEDGVLAEDWDVIQDEATREQSRSGLPMYGDRFPEQP